MAELRSGRQANPFRGPWPRVRLSDLARPSVVSLLLANLFPLYGVLFLGWDVFLIILLFWLENVVIGAFNVLRLLVAAPRDGAPWALKAFLVPFFCVHYGGFCAGHGVFVVGFFGGAMRSDGTVRDLEDVFGFARSTGLKWAVLGLVLSHGVSFVMNYVRKGEYRNAKLEMLMFQPYGRIVVLHLTIILGGMAALALGSPVWALVLLIGLKVAVDLKAHLRERNRLGRPQGSGTEPAVSAP